MRKVEVDKVTRTVKAQGGCLAKDVEDAAYAEGLSVVMGAVNDTGKQIHSLRLTRSQC